MDKTLVDGLIQLNVKCWITQLSNGMPDLLYKEIASFIWNKDPSQPFIIHMEQVTNVKMLLDRLISDGQSASCN